MRDGRGWRALQLEEVDSLPWADTELEWRPLREALGARIVGMAGFSAGRAEQELVEGHTEDNGGRGQEEVYIVLDGRARFTLDGEELDAPAGTFVRVDPAVHRRAVAVRPRTSVLALGGPPSFEPSASEWIERARPHIRSNPALARQIVEELRSARPHSPGIPIAEALLAVGAGDTALATRKLGEVLGEEPGLRTALAQDPDLAPLLDGPN
jgi:hypothetical protein